MGRVLVLIGGCSRVGKSWLARMLSGWVETEGVASLVVELDSWIVSVEKRRGSRVTERYDCAAIVRAVEDLLRGRPTYPPVYDVRSRRRVSDARPTPVQAASGLILAEGTIALALPRLREMATCKIYVSVPDWIRQERLWSFYRDVKQVVAGEAMEILREREAEEVPFVRSTRAYADIVFEGAV